MNSPAVSRFERNQGLLSANEVKKQLKIAYDAVRRNSGEASSLNNQDYRQLRIDNDRKDKEDYETKHAQEEDDWDLKVYKMNGGIKSTLPSSCIGDEEAEEYLEVFPNLSERLFQALDGIKEHSASADFLKTQDDISHLNTRFNCMAQLTQSENIGLDNRISELSKQLRMFQFTIKSLKESLNSSLGSLEEISKANATAGANHNTTYCLMEVIMSLQNMSEDFELYWAPLTFTSRRLGMLEVQKRLYKMLNVMILNTRVIRETNEIRKRDFNKLQSKFHRILEILKENNITFKSETFIQGERDKEQPESNVSIPESSERYRKKRRRKKKRKAKFIEERSNILTVPYDFLRRELYWPWNREQTKQGFNLGIYIVLMIICLGISIWSLLSFWL